MNHSPRHSHILSILEEEGTITISALAQRLAVRRETVRREVRRRAARGARIRMHGAIGRPAVVGEAPFEKRMEENRAAKEAIARLTAATIADSQSIRMYTGTT